MKNLFYTFSQNNSGGYFVEDNKRGVCEYVIVEAESALAAIQKLSVIGEDVDNFWSYCSCCGERWSDYMEDEDGKDVPSIYNEPVSTLNADSFRSRCFVHYADGTFKEFIFPEKVKGSN